MDHQNNIQDIDSAIQSILSRITPVNDKLPQTEKRLFDGETNGLLKSKEYFAKPYENCIRIEGNHNIIISSSIIPLALFFLSLLTLISTINN